MTLLRAKLLIAAAATVCSLAAGCGSRSQREDTASPEAVLMVDVTAGGSFGLPLGRCRRCCPNC